MLTGIHLMSRSKAPACLKERPMTSLRRSLITIIAVLTLGVVAACSPGGGSSAEPSAPVDTPTEVPSESASP
jgi:hypothetical protein